MIKRRKILAVIMATMIATTALVGCGGDKKSGGEKLTVWSHLSADEVADIKVVAEKWGKDNNVEVTVVADDGKMQDYKEAASGGQGPDIYYGLAHDNLGTFQKADLLAEIPEGTIDPSKMTSQSVIDAVTIDGKQYAVPVAQEAIALFYNKALVPEAPKTLEEVVTIGKEKGFKFNVSDFYLAKAIIAANGGYVFKDNNGTLDQNDIGLNNEGAVKGYQFLQDLVIKDKLIEVDITDDIAKSLFNEGKTAFYISGPWNVKSAVDAGIDLGVMPIPTLDGGVAKPFLGVQAAFVSKSTENKDLAWKLMSYLNENTSDIVLEKGNRIPVTKAGLESEAFKSNKYMKAFLDSASVATPMPNIPAVQAMWEPGKNNIISMIKGDLTPQQAADKTVEDIKEGIKQIK